MRPRRNSPGTTGDQRPHPVGKIGDSACGPAVAQSVQESSRKCVTGADRVNYGHAITRGFNKFLAKQQGTALRSPRYAHGFPTQTARVITAKLFQSPVRTPAHSIDGGDLFIIELDHCCLGHQITHKLRFVTCGPKVDIVEMPRPAVCGQKPVRNFARLGADLVQRPEIDPIRHGLQELIQISFCCLLYLSPSPRDYGEHRMPSFA